MQSKQMDRCPHCGQSIQMIADREFAGWSLGRESMIAKYNGATVLLTPAEFMVLYALMATPGETVSGEAIMLATGSNKAHWGILKVYICRLRKIFKHLNCDASIQTAHGIGYRMMSGAEQPSIRLRFASAPSPRSTVIPHDNHRETTPFLEIKKSWGVVVIDEADADLLEGYTLSSSGHDGSKLVAVTSRAGSPKVRMALASLIMRPPEGMMVDHINGDPFDNRRSNLRICSKAQNQKNRTKTLGCSSRYKGVSWNKNSRKWMSGINSDGQVFRLGSFDTEEDAARAYDNAARHLHGEFAALNFPDAGERSALMRGDASILSEAAA